MTITRAATHGPMMLDLAEAMIALGRERGSDREAFDLFEEGWSSKFLDEFWGRALEIARKRWTLEDKVSRRRRRVARRAIAR